jgi:DNA topoisomerase-1
MAEGEALKQEEVRPIQHFTQPPPRFSEASLVKAMEELGIGRPSTYASIIQVLQERDYVRLEARRFIPEDRGRVVTAFLENFFNRYVQYHFTADLENQLDDVSDGKMDWKTVLRDFWKEFSLAVDGTKELRVSEVLDTLDRVLGPHFFPEKGDGHDPRLCPTCQVGRIGLRLGKFGAFIGCSNYPECRFTRPLSTGGEEGAAENAGGDGPRALGEDPTTGLPVIIKKGPYGFYVQLGDGEDKTEKPKRVSLPNGMEASSVDLDRGLKLLALPREIGTHPETAQTISAGIGRFGPYLKLGDIYKSLPKGDDVLEIGMNRAVELLAGASAKPRTPAKELGAHPGDGKPVTQGSGRFGPYVSHNKVYANLPKGQTEVTLEEAVALLAAKAGKSGKKPPAKAKAAPAKKPAAKKAPAKKKVAAT